MVPNSSFDANHETNRTLDIMKLRLGADAPEQNPALWAQFAARRLNAESPRVGLYPKFEGVAYTSRLSAVVVPTLAFRDAGPRSFRGGHHAKGGFRVGSVVFCGLKDTLSSVRRTEPERG